jgi:hypothetical protein
VGAHLGDTSGLKHHDEVGMADRAEPMGDHECGAVAH